MSNKQLKQAIMNIRESLADTESVDDETLELAQALEADLNRIASQAAPVEEISSSLDLAIALEAKFESEHPVTAGFVREVIDALHKMGI
ncbi:MAG: hypothetical protein ACI9Y1_001384 [Lentisphaeria bacterium]|jgi:hypothetical protein